MSLNILHRRRTTTAPAYSPEYQNVLNHATANSITPPSTKYNIILNKIVSKLVADGVWGTTDVLYYFKHDGSREFATLNYKDPAKHRLIDKGANPVTFTPEVGFEVSGGNSQVFSTQFTPSVDAVNLAVLSSSVYFKLTQTPTSSAGVGRILSGAGSNSANMFNIINQQGTLLTRVMSSNEPTVNLSQTTINRSYLINDYGSNKAVYQDDSINYGGTTNTTGSSLTTAPLFMFGYNPNNGTPLATEGKMGLEYLGMGASMEGKVVEIYDAFNNQTFEKTLPGLTAFTASQTSEDTVFFGQINKASKFPSLTTTKPYIVTYGNNHGLVGANDGKCMWGEMDDLDGTGFIERGIIVSGYQANSPFIQLVPDDPDGLFVHFYWHPASTHPDSGGYQQTRLWRRAGGNLHDDAGWTKDGKVLGLINPPTTETHTGYLSSILQPDGSFIGIHSAKGGTPPNIGKSTALSDGKTWTRVSSNVDVINWMPKDRQFHYSPFLYFTRNSKQYCAGRNATYNFDTTKSKIGIAICANNDYLPTKYLGDISGIGSGNANTDVWFYIDENTPDILNIYYVMGDNDVKRTTWDLKNLD